MAKMFRCCFPNCKRKHVALIVIIDHMAKEHKLRINGKSIYVKTVDAKCVDCVKEDKE